MDVAISQGANAQHGWICLGPSFLEGMNQSTGQHSSSVKPFQMPSLPGFKVHVTFPLRLCDPSCQASTGLDMLGERT